MIVCLIFTHNLLPNVKDDRYIEIKKNTKAYFHLDDVCTKNKNALYMQ